MVVDYLSDFFNSEEHWQIFFLENLLVSKKLFDKGFCQEASWLDIEAGCNFNLIAEILFGKENVRYEEFEPVLSSNQELLLEKGEKIIEIEASSEEEGELLEKANALCEYLYFYHYKLEIRIPELDLLWPNQVKKIESAFGQIAYTLEEWERDTDFADRYPYTSFLGGAGWLLDGNGEKIGIWFHTISNDYDDLGWDERSPNEFLIKVWDSLRIARAFHLRRKSPFKRLILFSGGNANAQSQHVEAVFRIKRNPGSRKKLRQRIRSLA